MTVTHFRRHGVPQKRPWSDLSDWTEGDKMSNRGELGEGRVFQDLAVIVHEGSLTHWHWEETLVPRDLNGHQTKAAVDV